MCTNKILGYSINLSTNHCIFFQYVKERWVFRKPSKKGKRIHTLNFQFPSPGGE